MLFIGQLQQSQMQQGGGMIPNQFQQSQAMMQMKHIQQPGMLQPGMNLQMQQGVNIQAQGMQRKFFL